MPTLFLHLILIFLITTSATNLILPVHSNCIEAQKQSLLHFKESLTVTSDSPSSKLITWDSSTDCCSWLGVTCSTNGRVVGLDLSNEDFTCSIDNSSSLFQLQHLQSLNLADNNFKWSSIPSAIGKLADLRYLNLASAYFSGKVPIEVARLKRLVVLDLSENLYDFKFENPKLSMLIQNLTELTELHLNKLELSGQRNSDWCEAISSSLPNLRVLSLYDCGLSGPICESLAKLQSLYHIDLAGNNFHAPVPREVFANFSNLTYLSLHDSYLLGTFPKETFQIPSLQTIDLSNNADLHGSFPIFPNNGSLRFLDVHETSFSGELSNSIGNLKMLSSINLSKCTFIGIVPKSIENLKQLVYLDISYNKFHSPISSIHWDNLVNLRSLSLRYNQLYGTIPSSVLSLPILEYLTLSNNPFSGQVPEVSNTSSQRLLYLELQNNNLEGQIPTSIFNLQGLEQLLLSSNNFSGFPFNGLHGQPINLLLLDLSHNSLLFNHSSTNSSSLHIEDLSLASNKLRVFPDFFRNQTTNDISMLDLSENQIQGQIPNWILSLNSVTGLYLSHNSLMTLEAPPPNSTSMLTYLDLHSNMLQAIHSSYSFPELYELSLASNKLTTFPDFLKDQNMIARLDLSDNLIQGQVPNWIWSSKVDGFYRKLNFSCNSLESLEAPLPNSTYFIWTLDLHSNQLQGHFPSFLSGDYLDYSRNNFSYSIPIDIGNFISDATYLSFSSNNFQGVIPKSICNATGTLLDLSDNYLSGDIPQCLTQIYGPSNLVLNLGSNNLNGTIPDNFNEYCELQTLDLSRNHIQGHFPKSLVNCSRLEALNLGNNYLTDTFPCDLMSISTLRLLVLRSNQFYGSITCPKTNGTWPLLQIIDLAHNNFNGVMPGRMSLTWQPMVSNDELSFNLGFPFSKLNQYTAPDFYYRDEITAIIKGFEFHLVKIPTIFTLVDFSANKFKGTIPEEFGELQSLYVLNLSGNALTGKIPSSFGQMRQLESLDLSKNHLSGQIPPQLANLSFLAFLDLSNNELVGKIPTSTQFSTFPNTSFEGNKGLWGPPLTVDVVSPPPSFNGSSSHLHSGDGIDWDVIFVEIGFTCGFGIAIGSLLFCKRWRKWYYKAMRNILFKIFPQLEHRFGVHRRHVHINTRR